MDAKRQDDLIGARIAVTGIVQGVGFRPFVYNLARGLDLRGQVRNTGAGVEIILLGDAATSAQFLERLQTDAPPLAQIEQITAHDLTPEELAAATQLADFTIMASASNRGSDAGKTGAPDRRAFVPVSPDVALCEACRAELLEPHDRRYRYPFINCTNCGPRYTIIRDVPYDRPATTMADFALCPACRAEYEDPNDRRFHAQPNACPVCGPRLWFTQPNPRAHAVGDQACIAAQQALAAGEIVAIKGIGGFHLACDAANAQAVAALRTRKGRAHKPFAVMAASLAVAEQIVRLSPAARAGLTSPARPIVLAPMQPDVRLAPEIAPHNHRLGVMLPYAPLHYLLFLPSAAVPQPPSVLVMTSGNRSEEPIVIDNAEAQTRLGDLADAFLLHDRPIYIACDDSVVAHLAPDAIKPTLTQDSGLPQSMHAIIVRRSRGYAPSPIPLPFEVKPVLATGGELKNTLCVARDRHAFLSGHIGDLANLETLRAFEQAAAHMQRLFRVEPQRITCDLHPRYLATTWAQELAQSTGLPLVYVQHHHAHVAALMAEHQLPPDAQIIGVALDGTGYGPDETIWGGEFLLGSYGGYRRMGRLRPLPLPGGDASIQRPYRMALAALWACGLDWTVEPCSTLPPVTACPPAERDLLRRQLARNFNCIPTSSMGRFFDAVAALAGVCTVATYEAQGAIQLEGLLHTARESTAPAADAGAALCYPFNVEQHDEHTPRPNLGQTAQDHVEFEIDTRPVFHALVAQLVAHSATGRAAASPPRVLQCEIAARTHETVAALIEAGCVEMRTRTGHNRVGLTGGVFQNATLLAQTIGRLRRAGFEVLCHRRVPPNDGGLALGQAIVAGRISI